jgi:hypothetical protein
MSKDKHRHPAIKPKRYEVREPIQVYLAADERAVLDQMASLTGYSRAEVLRRGLRGFAAAQLGSESPMLRLLGTLHEAHVPEDLAARHDEHLVREIQS